MERPEITYRENRRFLTQPTHYIRLFRFGTVQKYTKITCVTRTSCPSPPFPFEAQSNFWTCFYGLSLRRHREVREWRERIGTLCKSRSRAQLFIFPFVIAHMCWLEPVGDSDRDGIGIRRCQVKRRVRKSAKSGFCAKNSLCCRFCTVLSHGPSSKIML